MAAAMAPFASLSKTYGQGLENAMERTPKASPPSDLKITDVKCAYSGGGLFVKISTNQDIVGWGEGSRCHWRNLSFSSTAGKATESEEVL